MQSEMDEQNKEREILDEVIPQDDYSQKLWRGIYNATLADILKILRLMRCLIEAIDNIEASDNVDFMTAFNQLLDELDDIPDDFATALQNNILELKLSILNMTENDVRKYIDDTIIKMLSQGYNPPNDLIDIYNHLVVIFLYYYENYNEIITMRRVIMDNYMKRRLYLLFIRVSQYYVQLSYWGKDQTTRIRKAKKVIKSKSDAKKTIIYEIYYRNPDNKIIAGMKLNKVINIVKFYYERWQKQGKIPQSKSFKTPSIDQIKRYLWEDEKIKGDFSKIGRYWILQG